ncbi:hypothetical protein ACFQL9_13120 [Halobaculum lipolyticum]|uniref:Uncharacterized protein n=1 Tax=Halobaculum lipolyticum TaxID=3032001 RepID=A0ABD5WCA2_9EURY
MSVVDWIFYVIMPAFLFLAIAGVPSIAESLILGLSASACLVTYIFLRIHSESQHVAIGASFVAVLLVSLVSIDALYAPEENIFELYLPYYGALAAWAFPTLMWQEAEWIGSRQIATEDSRAADSRGTGTPESTEPERLRHVLPEALGFLAAVSYTQLFVVLNVSGGSRLGSRLFLGFLVTWVIYRWWAE